MVEREPIVVRTPPNCRVPLLRGSWNPAASAELGIEVRSECLPAAEDAQLADEVEFPGDELPGPILERRVDRRRFARRKARDIYLDPATAMQPVEADESRPIALANWSPRGDTHGAAVGDQLQGRTDRIAHAAAGLIARRNRVGELGEILIADARAARVHVEALVRRVGVNRAAERWFDQGRVRVASEDVAPDRPAARRRSRIRVRLDRAVSAAPVNVTAGVMRFENLYSPMAGA